MTLLWKLFKRWWRLVAIAVVAVFALLFVRWWFRDPAFAPLELVTRELEAIRAGVEADKLKAELGHREALQHIDDKYAEEVRALNKAQVQQARKLREDPEALTRFLVRGRA